MSTTTFMGCTAPNHKGQSASEFSNASREICSAELPRTKPCAMDAGQMHCHLLAWAAAQKKLSPHLQGVLVRIVVLMESDGTLAWTQAAIAEAIGVSERQTRAAVAALVEAQALTRKRRGGIGAGRVCDVLSANMAHVATGDVAPVAEQPATSCMSASGGMSPEATGDNEQPATGGMSPLSLATGDVAPVEIAPRVSKEHARVCAETLNLNTSTSEINPETPELVVERGVGRDLFGAGETKPATPTRTKPASAGTKRRPKREKFYASEATMLGAPNEAMCEYAAQRHLLNGERAIQFGKFRRYHIDNGTLIASIEQRWETWVDNWAKSNSPRADGARKGVTFVGIGPDGHPRYVKNQRANVYR
jgi:hypothetical protein